MKKVVGIFFLYLLFCFSLLLGEIAVATPESYGDYEQLIQQARGMVEYEPEKAISMLQDASSLIDQDKDPASASAVYSLLGDAYYYQDNLDQSLLNYQKAADIQVLAGLEMTNEHIYALGNLGYIYDLKEQHIIALDFYSRALTIARELGNMEEIANNLANLGKVQTLQGYYREALRNMEEALALDRKAGDEPMIATDLNTIGRIYESWGMFDKAAEYIHKALEINLRLNEEDKVAVRYNSLGLVYKAWGKHEQALDYFQKALAIDKKNKNDDKIALRQANIGSTYMAMGQTSSAITNLKLGLDYFEENGMTSYAASSLIDLGKCYMTGKEFRPAEESFLRAIEYSRPGRLNRTIMNSLEQLSQLYHQTNQFEKAFLVQSEFMRLKDSLFNAESQKKIMEFQVRYELDNKQQQIELMKLDQELVRKRHVTTRLVLSILGLTLAIIVLALLVRLRNNQNRRLIAEKENQALRAYLELRNKELTYNAMCIIKNNETVAKIAETIEDAISSGEDKANLNRMIRQLQNTERKKNWTEFEVRFTQVHEDFYDRLNKRFPDLTSNERKLCAFLRLNMSTKDIAAITHQSVNSINVARTRLRRKLGIDGTDENLVGFLQAL